MRTRCKKESVCIQLTLGLHGGSTATKQWSNVSTFQWLDKRGLADTAVSKHQHSNTWERLAGRAQLTPVHLAAITNDWLYAAHTHGRINHCASCTIGVPPPPAPPRSTAKFLTRCVDIWAFERVQCIGLKCVCHLCNKELLTYLLKRNDD